MKTEQEVPQICKNCTYCFEYKSNFACGRTNIFKFILFGPELVKFDGWCNRFEYAKKYESQQKTR